MHRVLVSEAGKCGRKSSSKKEQSIRKQRMLPLPVGAGEADGVIMHQEIDWERIHLDPRALPSVAEITLPLRVGYQPGPR